MSNKRVLILEDDVFLVKVMQKKFEKSGHEVTILFDGLKTVETAKEFKPEVILVDLIMPEKDGFSAISDLKADPETKDIPVIITSNLSTDKDIKKGKELGANKYFIKSNVDLKQIINYISGL